MLKIVCPKCKKDDKWEVYEVLNDPRRNYGIRCFNCHERFVLPDTGVNNLRRLLPQGGLS